MCITQRQELVITHAVALTSGTVKPAPMGSGDYYVASIAHAFRTASHICSTANIFVENVYLAPAAKILAICSDTSKIAQTVLNYDENFWLDLTAFASGLVSKTVTYLQTTDYLPQITEKFAYFSEMGTAASMIHALLMINKLLPVTEQRVRISLTKEQLKAIHLQDITADAATADVEAYATIDFAPSKLRMWLARAELTEKIAEFVEQSVHFFSPLIIAYLPLSVSLRIINLHDVAHDVETVLHTQCVVSDIWHYLSAKNS